MKIDIHLKDGAKEFHYTVNSWWILGATEMPDWAELKAWFLGKQGRGK